MTVEPVTLTGRFVRLEPLAREHVAGLCAVGLDPSIWRLTGDYGGTADAMRAWVENALDQQARGLALPFVTRELASGTIVGSTRFGNIEPRHRRVEIGWTWIAPAWQRTAVNTEAKRLMLAHAFGTWDCLRVEFKTDALNERSRAALLRIGAREEGTLRQHVVTWTGRVRDTVYFSILRDEWPAVRDALDARLGR